MPNATYRANALPPKDAAPEDLVAFIDRAHPVDVAHWMERQAQDKMGAYLSTLPPKRRSDIFKRLSTRAQKGIAEDMPSETLVETATLMAPDDRADLFKALDPVQQQSLMDELTGPWRDDLQRLSTYPERSAGAIMTSGFAVLTGEISAQDALAALREQADHVETINLAFVVDEDGTLIGTVPLSALVVADDGVMVDQIMEPSPATASVDDRREDVAKQIARYDLLALPVVDEDNRLEGIITHDDATDALQAEVTEDLQRISTVVPFSQSITEASIRLLYSKRIVWLALLVFGNMFSGAGIAYFEETILAYVSLVFFMPLLIDSSGNAGAQSATLMVRAMATGDVEAGDWRKLIARELLVAAALGATMAAIVWPLGAWRGGTDVATAVATTMFLVVIFGSLVGMSLPFILNRFKLDPATASGPLVTTISDAVGVLVYFSIATLLLSL